MATASSVIAKPISSGRVGEDGPILYMLEEFLPGKTVDLSCWDSLDRARLRSTRAFCFFGVYRHRESSEIVNFDYVALDGV